MLIMSLLLSYFPSYAQEKTITGMVTGDDTRPLPGVTVTVKETKKTSVTDAVGKFSIVANVGQTLQISYVGHSTQELVVGTNSNVVTIQLVGAVTNTLNDVVVVGYGAQKKGNLSGAVSTVDVKKMLTGRAIPDVGRGLQGAAAGLSVTIPSGEV